MTCAYCGVAAGYVASCGDGTVSLCTAHVGRAIAVWLYDMGRESVEVRRLRAPAIGARLADSAVPEGQAPKASGERRVA